MSMMLPPCRAGYDIFAMRACMPKSGHHYKAFESQAAIRAPQCRRHHAFSRANAHVQAEYRACHAVLPERSSCRRYAIAPILCSNAEEVACRRQVIRAQRAHATFHAQSGQSNTAVAIITSLSAAGSRLSAHIFAAHANIAEKDIISP